MEPFVPQSFDATNGDLAVGGMDAVAIHDLHDPVLSAGIERDLSATESKNFRPHSARICLRTPSSLAPIVAASGQTIPTNR